jgi:Rho family protein
VELSLWDTAGQEEFDRLRSLSYDDTHAIMLCFSVDSPDSLENVETKWVGEIAENCPGVKLVLVALKCDLRKRDDDDAENAEPEKPCIDYDEGLRVAEKIKALRYLGMKTPRLNISRCFANRDPRMLRHEEPRC